MFIRSYPMHSQIQCLDVEVINYDTNIRLVGTSLKGLPKYYTTQLTGENKMEGNN